MTTRLMPFMLVAAVIACASGCAKPDWIQADAGDGGRERDLGRLSRSPGWGDQLRRSARTAATWGKGHWEGGTIGRGNFRSLDNPFGAARRDRGGRCVPIRADEWKPYRRDDGQRRGDDRLSSDAHPAINDSATCHHNLAAVSPRRRRGADLPEQLRFPRR